MSFEAAAATSVLAHKVSGRGRGAPVLLLNGGLMSIAAWDPLAAPLEERFRVVRCDFRGQLLSPGLPPPTLDGHVGDVLELLDHLELDEAAVVGTSFGAEVGLLLAARHPSRVRALVAANATDHIRNEQHEALRLLRRACRGAAHDGDRGKVFDLLVPGTFSPGWLDAHGELIVARRAQVAALPRSWFQALDGLLGALEFLDLREALAAVRCPTLVVAAGQDLTFPVSCASALAKQVRAARLEVVEESGHALVVERPDAFLDLVLPFLATHVRNGGDA